MTCEVSSATPTCEAREALCEVGLAAVVSAKDHEHVELVAVAAELRVGEIVGARPLCKTVANNPTRVFTKLQVTERARAIVRAHRAGIGNEPDPRG